MNMTTQVGILLVTLLVSGLCGGVIILIPKGEKWLVAKTASIKNDELRTEINAAIYGLGGIAETIVSAIKQQVVDPMKTAGTFTPQAAADAAVKAKTLILAQLTSAEKNLLTTKYGNLDMYVEALVESLVNAQNPAPAMNTTPATPPPVKPVLTDEQKAVLSELLTKTEPAQG